jgi:hypothetical protein
MLDVFIEKLGSNFSQYVEEATKLIAPLCNYNTERSNTNAACRCLPGLVKCVKNQPQICIQMVKYFISILHNAAVNEYDSEVIIA